MGMSRSIKIENDAEKNKIIIFLLNAIYPPNLTKEQKKTFRKRCKNFLLIDGVLKYRDDQIIKDVVLSNDIRLKNRIISEFHNVDHARVRPTFERVKSAFVGITVNDVKSVLNVCINCLRETPPNLQQGITPILSNYCHERLIVDTIDLRIYAEHNDGFNYVFTMIDSFSKFGWIYKSKRKDSNSFSKILMKHFYREGLWSKFHSDNGGEFVNNQVDNILEQFNIESIHGRPYHPQSQGQIERFNRTIKSRLRKSFQLNEFNWIKKIDKIVYFYNNSFHRATGIKPFILFKGYDANIFNIINDRINDSETARLRLLQYIETYRRELNFTATQSLEINSRVLLLKPYNLNIRRRTFDSIYYDNIYIILEINENHILIFNESNNETIRTLKFNVKKI
ncbi:Pro-Pol polyprotein [Dictyocoela muelleri]|nr:Pro-Pol polyprotein [Dictyocoela muelleri]